MASPTASQDSTAGLGTDELRAKYKRKKTECQALAQRNRDLEAWGEGVRKARASGQGQQQRHQEEQQDFCSAGPIDEEQQQKQPAHAQPTDASTAQTPGSYVEAHPSTSGQQELQRQQQQPQQQEEGAPTVRTEPLRHIPPVVPHATKGQLTLLGGSTVDILVLEMLGNGRFGQVFKAMLPHDLTVVALKVHKHLDEIDMDPAVLVHLGEVILKQQRAEQAVLSKLSQEGGCPYIVKCFGLGSVADHNCVALEYLPCSSIGRVFEHLTPTLEQARLIISQVASAVKYLHDRAIAHRDISMGNVLWDHQQKCAKLGDFGTAYDGAARSKLSVNSEEHAAALRMSTFCGTERFIAPEVELQNRAYGPSVDIWSLGCLCLSLVTRREPFPDMAIDGVSVSVKAAQTALAGEYGKTMPDEVVQFAQQLLVEKERRPSAEDVLCMPFCIPL